MALPQNNRLPISCLAGIFNSTSATYKYYWFVAMLDILVKVRKTRMSFWEIIEKTAIKKNVAEIEQNDLRFVLRKKLKIKHCAKYFVYLHNDFVR